MTPKPLPNAEYLRKLLAYDPETGRLTWRTRPPEMFPEGKRGSAVAANVWNGANAGKPALNSRTANGYLHGAIDYESFLAHRVIWKLMTGADPLEIDHINGDRTDNRWANLAHCDRTANMRNRGLSRNNRSGYSGVHWNARFERWEATMQTGALRRYLGRFVRLEDAVAARANAEKALGYHPNHGKRPGRGVHATPLS